MKEHFPSFHKTRRLQLQLTRFQNFSAMFVHVSEDAKPRKR